MKAFCILVPLVSAVYVSAHGILKTFTANGVPVDGVIRKVSSQDPNRGASNPALVCGPDSKPAPKVASVMPGDELSFDWRTLNGEHWKHNTGPMMTYLANCGDVTCDKFNANNARWFKIDEVGRKPNSDKWFQGDLMEENGGGVAKVKLPGNLAAGNYLVRHEILSLHLAQDIRMAEFYPACVQLKVGGNQNGRPAERDLVPFPGAYSDNDPGILTRDIYNTRIQYDFPGPNVATLSGSGAPAPSGNNNNGNNVSPPAPAPSAGGGKNNTAPAPPSPSPAAPYAPAQTGKDGSCKLKKGKRSPVDADTKEADNERIIAPRHVSRIMRRLAFGGKL